MNILELKNVNYSYDGYKLVLKDINLSFEKGKVYGIFGKSGAGKTTLLSLMAGLDIPTNGTIYYKDQNLNEINKDKYRANEIGVIFQNYNLLSHLTALENVILSIDISELKDDNKIEKAHKLLEKVGIDEKKSNRKVLKLSGGEQQRVSIARALASDPEIILADEPSGNLDKDTELDIINLLKDLAKKEKKCVIIISHSQKVHSNVDKVYMIDKGRIKTNEK